MPGTIKGLIVHIGSERSPGLRSQGVGGGESGDGGMG